jgi:hypothetical protein
LEENVVPGTTLEMMNHDFWIKRTDKSDKVIMSPNDIERFNGDMSSKLDAMVDLRNYQDNMEGNVLKELIESYTRPSGQLFDENIVEISEDFYEIIECNRNIEAIKKVNPVRYGLAITNTRIRSFPTDKCAFKADSTSEFDRLQEAVCQALQPVAILHESKDEKWFFVQIYNYAGWVKSEDIAIAEDKQGIFDYAGSSDFIVVTGNYIRTQYSPFEPRVHHKEFYMGTKIPLAKDTVDNVGRQSTIGNYLVKLPIRNEEGKLEFLNALIAMNQDVNKGYLPYTRENIIKQVFKLLGDRYDWGDKFNGRDCSSTMMNVYNTFGIRLPRNASQQEKGAGKVLRFKEDSTLEERNRVFQEAQPGAGIFMKGHVMMYLGEVEGVNYMIHNFHGYGKKDGENYVFVPVNEVGVTPVTITTASGTPFINKFSSVIMFEL